MNDGHHALAQQAANDKLTFNMALVEEITYQDLDITVRLKANTGAIDQGGGLIWRARDKDNYYIARYNPPRRQPPGLQGRGRPADPARSRRRPRRSRVAHAPDHDDRA